MLALSHQEPCDLHLSSSHPVIRLRHPSFVICHLSFVIRVGLPCVTRLRVWLVFSMNGAPMGRNSSLRHPCGLVRPAEARRGAPGPRELVIYRQYRFLIITENCPVYLAGQFDDAQLRSRVNNGGGRDASRRRSHAERCGAVRSRATPGVIYFCLPRALPNGTGRDGTGGAPRGRLPAPGGVTSGAHLRSPGERRDGPTSCVLSLSVTVSV